MIDDLSDLDPAIPDNPDLLSVGGGELRDIKSAVTKAFLDLGTSGGIVDSSAAEINHLAGVTSNVQAQINAKSPRALWTARDPDQAIEPQLIWNMQPNERLLPFYINTGWGNPQQMYELPAISASTDGDVIEIKSIANLATKAFIRAPTSESFRYHVNDPASGLFNTWIDAREVEFFQPLPYPHIYAIFSATYGKWVVRSLDVPALLIFTPK